MLKKHLLVYLLLFITLLLSAQESSRLITGKITDQSNGETLPGATIIVKGTMRGAMTNIDGEFTYQLNKKDVASAVLEFSFVGYETQEIIVGKSAVFNVALKPTYNALNEVVITSSYGTKKLKQEVVGSITSVKPQDIIVEQALTSIDQLLEGQAAGMLIETSEGLNSPVEIHIRGVGSLSGNSSVGTSTQPLIIVDGIILAEEVTIDGSAFFEGGGGLYADDPNNPLAKVGITDIESINILKDAAAVSLYGADGANGVLIIETKSGHVGKTQVSFSAQSGISMEMDPIRYMNGEQYRNTYNEYLVNTGQSSQVVEWNGVNTDWHNLLNDNGFYQNYNLSISGGQKDFTFRVGASYQDNQEPQINNEFKRIGSNISLSYSPKKLNLSLKVSPSYSYRNTPNSLSNFALPPDISPYQEDGSYTPFNFYGNPLAVAMQNEDITKTYGTLLSTGLGYAIRPGLSFSSNFGMDFEEKKQDQFRSGLNQTGIDGSKKGNRMLRNRTTNNWNWNAQLSFDRDFNNIHHIDAILGVETRGQYSKMSYLRGEGFEIYDSPQPIADAQEQDYNDDSSESYGRSLLSQLNYDYKKRYFVLLNARLDQSSAFGNDRNTSFNSALGLSWNISNESFMKSVDWIDFLRVKASYGSSGNSRIGSYRALGLYNYDDTEGRGYNQVTGSATPSSAPNPDLGWETNLKFNTGLELTTSSGISFNLEFYHDDIRDMIVSRDAIPESGYSSVQINGSEMYNRGIEFSASYHFVNADNFRWKSSFNISRNENKVTYLKGLGSESSIATSATAERVGYSTNLIWGYNFVGIDPGTGRELYAIDNRVVDADVIKSNYSDASSWHPIGSSQPDVYGGMNNRFTFFEDLTISANLSYKIGSYKLVDKTLVDNYTTMVNRNMSVNAYFDAWREPGDLAKYAAITINPIISNSSRLLYSTSHIKLNSVNISYHIPTNNIQWIKNLQMTATGTNLYYWYFDKSPKGMNGIKELNKTYSEMRTVTLGISASF